MTDWGEIFVHRHGWSSKTGGLYSRNPRRFKMGVYHTTSWRRPGASRKPALMPPYRDGAPMLPRRSSSCFNLSNARSALLRTS